MSDTIQFENLVPSTRTIINVLNINIDVAKVFDILETVPYMFPESKRGRRRKTEKQNLNKDIPNGSITSLTYRNEVKGTVKKKRVVNSKFFLNTLTIVMMVDNKLMNFKIFTAKDDGNKTQHPGCKDVKQAETTLLYLWDKIKHTDAYTFTQGKNLSVIFHTVMTNINFNLGFNVNRRKLNECINRFSTYNSMLETNIGHAGAIIKQPITEKIVLDDLPKITVMDNGEIVRELVTFEEYMSNLTEKQRMVQINKTRKNTFLVFHSGKTIMSGMVLKYMEEPYNNFIQVIESIKNDVEEKNI